MVQAVFRRYLAHRACYVNVPGTIASYMKFWNLVRRDPQYIGRGTADNPRKITKSPPVDFIVWLKARGLNGVLESLISK